MDGKQNTTWVEAKAYRDAGQSVIPIKRDGSKAPSISWKKFEKELATDADLLNWFGNGKGWGIGVLGGRVSGNLEHLDFDHDAADVFPQWCHLIEDERPDLIHKLSIRQTPRQP